MSRPQQSKRRTAPPKPRRKRSKRLRNMLGETLVTHAGVVKAPAVTSNKRKDAT